MSWEVQWNQGESVALEDKSVVRELIERLRASIERPTIVNIVDRATENSLGLGIAARGAVLLFQFGDAEPPYYHSLSQQHLVHDDVICFDFMGEPTDVPGEAIIDIESALRAVDEFLVTGGLPKCLQWDMD